MARGGAVLLVLGLALGGCADSPTPTGQTADPPAESDAQLAQEFKSITPTRPGTATPALDRRNCAWMTVEAVRLPDTADWSAARAMLHPTGLDPDELRHWRANALDAGTLSREDLPAFLRRLPAALGGRQERVLTGADPWPLGLTAPLEAAGVTAALVGPDGSVRAQQWQSGRVQWLFQVRPLDGETYLVELTPQHQFSQFSWQPLTSDQQLLQGERLADLRLLGALPTRSVLVVGLATNQPPRQALGALLLEDKVKEGALQWLLIIRVDPPPPWMTPVTQPDQ